MSIPVKVGDIREDPDGTRHMFTRSGWIRMKERPDPDLVIAEQRSIVASTQETAKQWHEEANRLRAQLAAAEAERADLNATFDLRYAADVRAIERWRQEHPERALILPDHADLCVWLLEQLTATEKDRDVWHLAHDLIINTDVEAQRAKALEEKLAAAEQRAETAERERADWRDAAGRQAIRAGMVESKLEQVTDDNIALRALVGELGAALELGQRVMSGLMSGDNDRYGYSDRWFQMRDEFIARLPAALAKAREVSG